MEPLESHQKVFDHIARTLVSRSEVLYCSKEALESYRQPIGQESELCGWDEAGIGLDRLGLGRISLLLGAMGPGIIVAIHE